MAITLTTLPAVFQYAGNPIDVEFTNDTSVANSIITFNATGGVPSSGAVITLYFDNEVVAFTYNYLNFTAFYNDLRQNYIIKRYFSLSLASNVITMTAYTNDDLNIDVVTDSNFTPCTKTVTNATGLGIDVYLGVAIHDGTTYKPTSFDKSHKVQKDGKAYFNIAEAFGFSKLDIPSNALLAFNVFDGETKKYRLEYAEHENSTTGLIYLSSDLFAINGAFNDDYLGNDIHNNIFLTASPRTIFTKDNEPRFLSFLAFTDYEDIEMQINAIDFEGDEYSYVKYINDLSAGDLIHIPICYEALGLDSESEAPFYMYELHIQYNVGATQYQTETFTIECNRQVSLNYSTFLFLNSRGGIDTISFEGETEETTVFSALEYQQTKTTGLNESKSEQHRIAYRFKQYSGYYDDWEMFQYIEELLNSKEVFWYKDGELKRVIIENSDFDRGSIHDDIYSVEFDFRLGSDDVAADLDFAPTTSGASVVITPPSTIEPDDVETNVE